MRLTCDSRKRLGRGFVLLAPPQSGRVPFRRVRHDPSRYQQLLAQAQMLRGRVYLQDGAIQPWQLCSGSRYIQKADGASWHLLTVDENEKVTACLRYLAHAPGVSFSDLAISQSSIAQSIELGPVLREAVETDIQCARRRGLAYVELGGWAISEELRCSTEAIRALLTVYAIVQSLGGARALTTATTRHHSSSILKRVGGQSLTAHGVEFPPYYDEQYKCEMELLRFDSSAPNARYVDCIQQCRRTLPELPVFAYEAPQPQVALSPEWSAGLLPALVA